MPRVREVGAELRDEIRQPLFDGIYISAAESPVGSREFFSNVQGKLPYLTNLRQNNLLEATVSFRLMGLVIDSQNWYEANRQALPLIMERSAVTLKIGEKNYWQANGLYVFGRLDQESAISTTVAATTEERIYQRYGDPAVQSVSLTGRHVVDIPPLQSFRVQWAIDAAAMNAAEIAAATPAANTRLLFLCSLKGLQRRPVQ